MIKLLYIIGIVFAWIHVYHYWRTDTAGCFFAAWFLFCMVVLLVSALIGDMDYRANRRVYRREKGLHIVV